MTTHNTAYAKAFFFVLLGALFLASCGLSSRPYLMVRTYSLDLPLAGDPLTSAKKPAATILVTASPPPAAYESKKLVYRLSASEFTQDYYAELYSPPARAIADSFAKYFDYTSPSLSFVRSQGVRPPDYALEIQLMDFYGEGPGCRSAP